MMQVSEIVEEWRCIADRHQKRGDVWKFLSQIMAVAMVAIFPPTGGAEIATAPALGN